MVLEQPGAAAFAVGGQQNTVVVTRGIIDLLSGDELSAVLAHEHAHLAARHHRWLTAAALVAQALPFVPLPRDAPALVGRLLEMDADELAATRHEPRVIASALVAVAAVRRRPALRRSRPSGARAASRAAPDALARVQRLLRPPAGLPAGRRALARAAIAALAMGPLLLAAAPIVYALRVTGQ